jgi:hypothetical protein
VAGSPHCRCRTISAAPHPRAAWTVWSESGRQSGVSELDGGEQPTAEASAPSASRSPLARTRNVAEAIAGPNLLQRSNRSSATDRHRDPCRDQAHVPRSRRWPLVCRQRDTAARHGRTAKSDRLGRRDLREIRRIGASDAARISVPLRRRQHRPDRDRTPPGTARYAQHRTCLRLALAVPVETGPPRGSLSLPLHEATLSGMTGRIASSRRRGVSIPNRSSSS